MFAKSTVNVGKTWLFGHRYNVYANSAEDIGKFIHKWYSYKIHTNSSIQVIDTWVFEHGYNVYANSAQFTDTSDML